MMQLLERYTYSGRLIYVVLFAAFFVMPLGTGLFTITEGAMVAAWVFSGWCWTRRLDYLQAAWLGPVLFVLVLKGVGLTYTPDFEGMGLDFAKKAHYWLVPFALSSLRFSKRGGDLLLYAFLAGLFVNASVAFLQLARIVPVFTDISRFGYLGFYGGYNTLAVLLILGMLTTSFFYRESADVIKKTLFGSLTAIFFLHLIILDSRGGYLVFVVICPLIIYNMLPRPSIRLTALICGLLIGAMLLSPVVRQRAWKAVEDIQAHMAAEESVRWGKSYSKDLDRIYMWRWAVDLFLERPILGVGTGGYYESMISAGADKGAAHPHNNLLHMAVSFGVLGIAGFIWLFLVLFRTGWRYRRTPVGFFTLSSTLLIFTGGMTETHILDAGGAFLLGVTTGLQTHLQSVERTSRGPGE